MPVSDRPPRTGTRRTRGLRKRRLGEGRRVARPTGRSCRSAVRRAGSGRATYDRARSLRCVSSPPGSIYSPPRRRRAIRKNAGRRAPNGRSLTLARPPPPAVAPYCQVWHYPSEAKNRRRTSGFGGYVNVRAFMGAMSPRATHAQEGKAPLQFEPDVLDAFERHSRPGNVRELRNEGHRLVLCAEPGSSIDVSMLPVRLLDARDASARRARCSTRSCTKSTPPTSRIGCASTGITVPPLPVAWG